MLTKKQIRENFPVLNATEINYYHKYQNEHGQTDRTRLTCIRKAAEKKEAEQQQEKPKTIEVTIEWKKSRTWGMCPTASMRWEDSHGWHYEERAAHASGCGYDKGSTVLAECLNKVLRGWLCHRVRYARTKAPYGCGLYSSRIGNPYFEGGIGINSYRSIAEWLGGRFDWKEGRTWDLITITF